MRFMARLQTGWRTAWLVMAFLTSTTARSEAPRTQPESRRDEALSAIARGRPTTRWVELTADELGALEQKAARYHSECESRHSPDGLIVSLRYHDETHTAIDQYEALDHSAAQTGFYLTALAFRQAVDRDLRHLPEIRRGVRAIGNLLTVSGRPGFIPRYSGLATDPAYQKNYAAFGGTDSTRPGFGKQAYQGAGPYQDRVWLGGVDRSGYATLCLALGSIHQLVRDAELRELIQGQVRQILDRLESDQWRLRDGQSAETFVPPLLSAALLNLGASIDPARYQSAYEARVNGPRLLEDLSGPGPCLYCDGSRGAETMACWLSLARLESNPTRRLLFQSKCAEWWRESSSHLNPWYAAAYVGAMESLADPEVRATLQGQLLRFPTPPRSVTSKDPKSIPRLPTLQANGATWSQFALPLEYQSPAPFQWAESPCSLSATNSPHREQSSQCWCWQLPRSLGSGNLRGIYVSQRMHTASGWTESDIPNDALVRHPAGCERELGGGARATVQRLLVSAVRLSAALRGRYAPGPGPHPGLLRSVPFQRLPEGCGPRQRTLSCIPAGVTEKLHVQRTKEGQSSEARGPCADSLVRRGRG